MRLYCYIQINLVNHFFSFSFFQMYDPFLVVIFHSMEYFSFIFLRNWEICVVLLYTSKGLEEKFTEWRSLLFESRYNL